MLMTLLVAVGLAVCLMGLVSVCGFVALAYGLRA